MFTGIIEEMGTIVSIGERVLEVSACKVLEGIALGDSIAVDGICLTVVRFEGARFAAGLSGETLARTNLGRRRAGDLVNLERALRLDSRLGGHIVSGHIDGVGRCLAVERDGAAWQLRFEAPEAVARYIVEKGSIAINGVSLTVAHCNERGDHFSVAIIPHSWSETTLSHLRPGDPVNLEADILGKYVEKLLSARRPLKDAPITASFLAEHGFG